MLLSILHKYLLLSIILFCIGLIGTVINRKSLINMILSIELMLLAVILSFTSFAMHNHDISGQVFVIFALTMAAAESSIGLALIILYYRQNSSIAVEKISLLKG